MTQVTTWGVPVSGAANEYSPEDIATKIDDGFDAILSQNRGASRPSYAVAGTVWASSTTEQLYYYDGTNDHLVAIISNAPASATDTGTEGQIAFDNDYLYRCIAADTWVRVGLATW